jgi:Arc/MetJ-type ribon-helix-helix transcriptional regulator
MKKKPRKKGKHLAPAHAVRSRVLINTQPVQVKLTFTERHLLDQLVTDGKFESRSAALRAGLGKLFEQWQVSAESDAEIEKERRRHRPRRSKLAR